LSLRIKEPARFGAWLRGIAVNVARVERRHRQWLSLDAVELAAREAPDPDLRESLGAAFISLSERNRRSRLLRRGLLQRAWNPTDA
jgi:DNA-directed RNA polymerase specialized sigma24 family protein